MKVLPEEIEYLLNQMPHAAEIYNREGQLIGVNRSWKELWKYKKFSLPVINIFDNKLIKKANVTSKLQSLFEDGGKVTTIPVLYEKGDFSFCSISEEMIIKFYLFSLQDHDGSISYIINLSENITEEIKQAESEKELEIQRRDAKAFLEILEGERKRIAQELHDVIGQKVLLAKINIELFQKRLHHDYPELKQSINQLIDISKEIKSIIHSLHPLIVEKYGLIDSLNLLVNEFKDNSGIHTVIKYYGTPEHENIKINLNIYRIVQESLNNVAKHSKCENVEIECHFTSKMIICSIVDNGIGFDQDKVQKLDTKGYNYGLISIKERAKVFGGDLTIESQIGKGTKVFFQIPIGNI